MRDTSLWIDDKGIMNESNYDDIVVLIGYMCANFKIDSLPMEQDNIRHFYKGKIP